MCDIQLVGKQKKKKLNKTKEGRSQRSRRSCTKLSSTSGCGLSLTAAAFSHRCSKRENDAFSSQVLCELSKFCPDLNGDFLKSESRRSSFVFLCYDIITSLSFTFIAHGQLHLGTSGDDKSGPDARRYRVRGSPSK